MSLKAVISELAANPTSIKARAAVAKALGAHYHRDTATVWASTARLAAGRGHFFVALTLLRRHLEGPLARQLLLEIAGRYGADRKSGQRLPPPLVKGRQVVIPEAQAAQQEMAVRLGTDLAGLVLPPDARMPTVPLFSALKTAPFVALAEAIEEVRVSPHQVLAAQGAKQPAMYILAQGEAIARQLRDDGQEVELARITAPAIIGEMSLLTAVPRRATVSMLTKGLAWRIDTATLKQVGAQQPQMVAQLTELVKARLLANLAQTSAVLSQVEGLDTLLAAFKLRSYARGAVIFSQGAPPPGLFLVLHGTVEIHAEVADGQSLQASLNEGDAFGEMSLLSGEPTTASAQMPEGGAVLHLTAESYREIRGDGPLGAKLEQLADVRRGELSDLYDPIKREFESTESDWFV